MEFVLTHVIMTTGACGREAPSSTRCAVSAAAAAAAAAGDEFRDLNFEQPFHHFCSLLVATPPLNSPPATSGGRARPWDVPRDSKVPLGRSWEPLGRSWVPLEDPGGAEYAVKSSLSGTKGA